MPVFKIEVAGHTVEVHSVHAGVARLCQDYIVGDAEGEGEGTGESSSGAAKPPLVRQSADSADTLAELPLVRQSRALRDGLAGGARLHTPELTVVSTPEKIAAERARDEDGQNYSDSYIETLVVQRAIAEWLPAHGAFLMHGATINYRGHGIIFCAASGVGKSTHIKYWQQAFGQDVQIVNGDKPFIAVTDANNIEGSPASAAANEATAPAHAGTSLPASSPAPVTAFGTPWAGKEGWQQNTSVPLEAICLLSRAATPATSETGSVEPPLVMQSRALRDGLAGGACEPLASPSPLPQTTVREVPAASVTERILAQTYIPANTAACFDTLGLVDQMLKHVKVYDVSVAHNVSAARDVAAAIFPNQANPTNHKESDSE